MSRYICVDDFEPDTEWNEYEDGFTSYSQLQIDCAPSIDIVRCGECKKWNGMYCFLGYATHAPKADDFCSYGERKESE